MPVVTRPERAQRPMLEIQDLVMAAPGAGRAVDGVSVGVEAGEFFTLLGPSPSG